jgi:hypothetical protein
MKEIWESFWGDLGLLFEKYKLARRILFFFDIVLIMVTWCVVVWKWGTLTQIQLDFVRAVFLLCGTHLTFYQWSRERDKDKDKAQ